MKELGYINEFGCLTSKCLSDAVVRYTDNGVMKERTVTVKEQAESLINNGWKYVDDIDESKTVCEDGYCVILSPYDAGDRISFNYIKKFDKQKVKRQIDELKTELSNSDYKISKCYEASLIGQEMPYDIKTLHDERQTKRDKINELENKINTGLS